MRRIHKLGAAALAAISCVLVPTAAVPASKDRPVQASRNYEMSAAAGGGYFAWERYARKRPAHGDVFLRKPRPATS